ncbi:MAG: putative acyl-CoA dehydrogenase [Planctomycetaceae bacterium]|nr:putative acyl-CoA dehydrogenase [Planctomycetaceae bacterium]
MIDSPLVLSKMTEEQVEVLQHVDAACRELRPIEDRYYLERNVNREVAPIFSKHNAIGFLIPTEFGGLGMDVPLYVRAMERVGQEGTSPRTFFSCHISIGASVISYWGDSNQQRRYLTAAAKGERIFGFGLTEPDAGSNPASMQTEFEKTTGGYLLNGGKKWIGNAAEGGTLVTFARDSSSGKISAFLIDADTPGYRAELIRHKLGLPTAGTCEVTYANCEIPRENLLGDEGQGMKIAYSALMSGRLGVAAGSIGIIADCLQESLAYSRSREQFGKPIGRHQLVQRHLGRMAVKLESTRALVYAAAERKAEYDADRKNQKLREVADILIAQAKYFAVNAAQEAAHDAVQVFGANGFLLTNRPARHYADARACQIYEGTNEILEQKIAVSYLGKEFEAFN